MKPSDICSNFVAVLGTAVAAVAGVVLVAKANWSSVQGPKNDSSDEEVRVWVTNYYPRSHINLIVKVHASRVECGFIPVAFSHLAGGKEMALLLQENMSMTEQCIDKLHFSVIDIFSWVQSHIN